MSQPPTAPDRRSVVEAVVASTVGTTIEWYDFFLYGTVAALVFPMVFFPERDPFVGRLLAFSTFTVGFLARPIGGAFFGYLGDRVGRKSTLVTTLLLMGISTFLIGVLPGYDQIGAFAPAILVLLRFLQGIGVGGEWGGAVLLALEYGHRGKRGFYASWPQAGVPLGLLTSTSVVALIDWQLDREAFLAWGWRIPFFLSVLLVLVGLLIRIRILETPLFRELQQSQQIARSPVTEVLREHHGKVVLAAGARVAEQSCFYLFTAYILAYNKDVLGISDHVILLGINLAAGLELFTIPLFGLLSDHFTRRRTYVMGCLYLAAFAFPYFALLETRHPIAVIGAIIGSLVIGHAMLYSVQASLIPELFGTRLRYTGASLGYQLASPFAGGLAPLIAVWLVDAFPGQYWPLALYIIVVCVISLVCVQMLAETSRKELT
jgi:metabolite-proton symporter